MNKRQKKKLIRKENKKLCERYPFLIPRHIWTDKIMWEVPKYDWRYTTPYTYTLLDEMPPGWRKAFGKQMCEEIRESLIKHNQLYDYRITQIKEKYGSLRWYDFGAPAEVYDIINKYSKMSEKYCFICGQPATKISLGWICPYCDKCAEKLKLRCNFKDIGELTNELWC